MNYKTSGGKINRNELRRDLKEQAFMVYFAQKGHYKAFLYFMVNFKGF